MSAAPQPDRGLRDRLGRIEAWAAATNARTADRLRGFGPRLRVLDGPWLLLLLVPALTGLRAVGASIAEDMTLAASVMLAGRRWRTGAIVPTLTLCLLELGLLAWLPAFGDIGMIPVLMIAARIGYDPGFLARVQLCATLSRTDHIVLGALALVGFCAVRAFVPTLEIYVGSPALLALVAVLLGASRVAPRVLALLVAGVAAHLLLAPFGRGGPFVAWGFGIWLFDAFNCFILFHAGRAIRQGPPAPTRGARVLTLAIVGLWLLLLTSGIFELRLSYPALRLGIGGGGTTSYGEAAGSALTAVGLAILAWIRARPTMEMLTARQLAIVATAFVLLPLLAILSVAMILPGGNLSTLLPKPGGARVALFAGNPTPNLLVNAVTLLSLCAGAILLLERWRPHPAPPAPLAAGSFMVTLLGPFWAGAVVGRAVVVAATAAVLAVAPPFVMLRDLARAPPGSDDPGENAAVVVDNATPADLPQQDAPLQSAVPNYAAMTNAD